jgi:hypothetical protein
MPEYHPNELPGLLRYETPEELGPRAVLLTQKHVQYISSFGQVWKLAVGCKFVIDDVLEFPLAGLPDICLPRFCTKA